MEVNEVIEDTSIAKEIVQTKEPEEEETVKEIADEVNYEDEEMPDTTQVYCFSFFSRSSLYIHFTPLSSDLLELQFKIFRKVIL